MWEEGKIVPDGAEIGRLVRSLAKQARRVLAGPVEGAEGDDLLEAIEELERQIEPGTSKELGRWLASLRSRVEAQLLAAV
jgi:hypothetical protein